MKKRLDAIMVERGLVSGRDRAKALVMAGHVYVNGRVEAKPGEGVDENDTVELRGGELKYVSRGGLKLEKALSSFGIMLEGEVCLDIGASTGGFTDCMLQNGAVKVFAVDVGYGQLAWALRQNPRVIVLERTNIRNVTRAEIPDPIGFASVDVSFISLRLVLPVARGLLIDEGEMVCLVKPQFEAGREKVGKKGVVRERSTHEEVLLGVCEFAAGSGFSVNGLDYSPITGPEGNIEYLLHLQKSDKPLQADGQQIIRTVADSHAALRGTP